MGGPSLIIVLPLAIAVRLNLQRNDTTLHHGCIQAAKFRECVVEPRQADDVFKHDACFLKRKPTIEDAESGCLLTLARNALISFPGSVRSTQIWQTRVRGPERPSFLLLYRVRS